MKDKSKLEGAEGETVEWGNTKTILEIFSKLKNKKKNIKIKI